MPFFENSKATLYYEERGSGNALFFLHGAALDMRQWERQAAHFSSRYRVITMDARGHGRSTLPPGPVSPEIFWQDVFALMNYLGIDKAIICGLSMGAHTALQLAINVPERISGLILIGTPCTNQFNLYERICLPVNRASLRIMPMRLIASILGAFLGSNREARDYIKDATGSLNHDNFNRIWKAVTCMESRPGLSAIQCPVLILIGDHDFMTRRQQAYIHQAIAGSALITINNANHVTNLDNPEQVEQEIELFLSDHQL